ncbi:hypothetical protein CPB86DRAFT_730807 [Serendipita vermifera]|nr:hypothetical protein CPB86DRAFT_730807 [Serendipita vermifera]
MASDISTYQRLHPQAYLQSFLAENLRPDGRALTECRKLQISQGSIKTANGSSLVRLGETTIVCGVKAEVAEPELDSPTSGFIVPNVEISAICSPRFKPGPPSEDAQVLSSRLYQAIVKSDIIPPASLCIQPGKAVWVLYIDAVCINYDGNAFDATLLAMQVALGNTKLPRPRFDEERRQTVCSRLETISLPIDTTLISTTFGIFNGSYLLADPTSFEEPLLDSAITVILQDQEVITVAQNGLGVTNKTDASSGVAVLRECVDIAKKRQEIVKQMISDSKTR